jgi:hypothetical protein
VFSREKIANPRSKPANRSDGSGVSKLNFMKLAPRGGTNTPVVERCATISAGASPRAARPDSSAAAPAAPATFSTSRRVCPSIADILSHLAGAEPTRRSAQHRCHGFEAKTNDRLRLLHIT